MKNHFEDRHPKALEERAPMAIEQLEDDKLFLQEVSACRAMPWHECAKLKSSLVEVSPESLDEPIVPYEKLPGKGMLNNLVERPDATNCAEIANFRKVFEMLFSKVETFKRKQPAYMEDVMRFQLWLLKTRFSELRRANPSFRKTLHEYTWQALRTAHKTQDREAIVRQMIGDFKRYSLTLNGRKDRAESSDSEEDTTTVGPASSGAQVSASASTGGCAVVTPEVKTAPGF